MSRTNDVPIEGRVAWQDLSGTIAHGCHMGPHGPWTGKSPVHLTASI